MDINDAIKIFDSLSQETRLQVFRLLVKAGSEGLSAGEISGELGTPHNTMSFHLNHLSNAGVVNSRRQGRSIIYTANYTATHGLIEFLVKDCCQGTVKFSLGSCCPQTKAAARKKRKLS